MFISGFGLLMAPKPISLKTIHVDSTVSQHAKENVTKLIVRRVIPIRKDNSHVMRVLHS